MILINPHRFTIPVPFLEEYDFTTGSLPPGVTVTRASTSPRFNSSGVYEQIANNLARLDYDPANNTSRGILIEPSRRNELIRSSDESYTNVWTASNLTVDPTATFNGPLGSSTMRKLTPTGSGYHNVYQQYYKFSQVDTLTFWRYVKTNGYNVYLQLSQNGGYAVYFDLMGQSMSQASPFGAIGGSPYTFVSSFMRPMGNGVYRIGMTVQTNTSDNIVSGVTGIADSNGNISYTANGVSGIYVGGAQMELGGYATSYIENTTSQITRAVETATISLPGSRDVLVQDRDGGAWNLNLPMGNNNISPRTNKTHVTRVRTYPPGTAAAHPEFAIAY